jgi:hypothetical protein
MTSENEDYDTLEAIIRPLETPSRHYGEIWTKSAPEVYTYEFNLIKPKNEYNESPSNYPSAYLHFGPAGLFVSGCRPNLVALYSKNHSEVLAFNTEHFVHLYSTKEDLNGLITGHRKAPLVYDGETGSVLLLFDVLDKYKTLGNTVTNKGLITKIVGGIAGAITFAATTIAESVLHPNREAIVGRDGELLAVSRRPSRNP